MSDMTLLVSKACAGTTAVLASVRDDQLDVRTPCEELSLRELLAHVGMLGVAFAAAARKDFGELTDTPPADGGHVLDGDWRSTYPANLAGLAEAWTDPVAWTGMTRIGGADLPGEVAALVALTEVVVHGWDVAVATGQPYDVDPEVAEVVLTHLEAFAGNGPVEGLFGPAVPVDGAASDFDRALALSGRDPAHWAHGSGIRTA